MPVVPGDEGPLFEPIDMLKQLIELNTEWLAWGTDRTVYLNEERSFIEGIGYLSTSLTMPFILLWIEEYELGVEVSRCEESHTAMMLIQDRAESRDIHQTSHQTFATKAGKLIRELGSQLRTHDEQTFPYSKIQLASPVIRTTIEETDFHNDIWTASFSLPMREL